MMQTSGRNAGRRYGGEILRRGSADDNAVRRLQRDLAELGFTVVGPADGCFGRFTAWAVREFQAYAALAQVAVESPRRATIYADGLTPVATGPNRYAGPISGVVDAATGEALQHWLDSRWRCPVAVEAWRLRNGRRDRPVATNIWRHDEVPDAAARMYARDLSGHFPVTGDGASADTADDDGAGRVIIGEFTSYLSWSGPRAVPPRHSRPEGEIVPECVIGRRAEELDAAQQSTFRVVRSVAEVECLGHFDSVNAYDNALISVGPCHWTLGIVGRNGTVSEGELCGVLAYLAHADAAAFHQTLGVFGVSIDRGWVNHHGIANGQLLFDRGQRKYAGWLALHDERGGFARLPQRQEESDYFKTWHWFYRFVMAGRTIPGYRRTMWDMTRIRLRDLIDMPWDAGSSLRLGDIFTSEKAIAMILRWHVRYPGHVAARGCAGRRLHAVLQSVRDRHASLGWEGDPGAWGDAHEKALIRALRVAVGQVGGRLAETVKRVDRWPQWGSGNNPHRYRLPPTIGPLDERRGSFRLERSGLPPAP
ncbi:MAG: peptidoglycan-binding protein [Rhodospirillales bacterium]|nr:peptidoglycan-binding protein [Rhodospirillales bacterium]